MDQQTLFLVAIAVLFIGFACLGISGAIFDWRAIRNKKAWNGLTKPFLVAGGLFTFLGLLLVYIFYPY